MFFLNDMHLIFSLLNNIYIIIVQAGFLFILHKIFPGTVIYI